MRTLANFDHDESVKIAKTLKRSRDPEIKKIAVKLLAAVEEAADSTLEILAEDEEDDE